MTDLPASPSRHHHITLVARQRPETLERILRVTRHRGFQVQAIHMTCASDNLHILLTVASPRPVESLSRQLGKLADISLIKTSPPLPAPAFNETCFNEIPFNETPFNEASLNKTPLMTPTAAPPYPATPILHNTSAHSASQ